MFIWFHFAPICQKFPVLSASNPQLVPTHQGQVPNPFSPSGIIFGVYRGFPKSLVLLWRAEGED